VIELVSRSPGSVLGPLYGSKREFCTRCEDPYSGPRRAERAKKRLATSQGLSRLPLGIEGIARAKPLAGFLFKTDPLPGNAYLPPTTYHLRPTSHRPALIFPPGIVSVEIQVMATEPRITHARQLGSPCATQQQGKKRDEQRNERSTRRRADDPAKQMGREGESVLGHAIDTFNTPAKGSTYG